MQTEELEKRKEDAIVFDVRPEEEYAVSHLPGAARIEPYDLGEHEHEHEHAVCFSERSSCCSRLLSIFFS